ncbi:UNVERIFIED_CONTAM: hypothetical protein BEN50_01825 [Euhalothece sp. KZN 001]
MSITLQIKVEVAKPSVLNALVYDSYDSAVLALTLQSDSGSENIEINLSDREAIPFDTLGDSEIIVELDVPENFGEINSLSLDWSSSTHPAIEAIKHIYIKEVDGDRNYDTGEIIHNDEGTVPIASTTAGVNDFVEGIYFNTWRTSDTINDSYDVGTFAGAFDRSGEFNPDGETYVLLHGWVNSGGNPNNDFLPSEAGMQMVTKSLLETMTPEDNLIWVDWSNFSGYELPAETIERRLSFLSASPSLAQNAQTTKKYLESLGFDNQEAVENLTVMGFSLGAQTAGLMGQLFTNDNLDIDEIYLFDPAGGSFFEQAYAASNQAEAASYQPFYANAGQDVYAFHSSKFEGYDFPIGDKDIYINAYDLSNPQRFIDAAENEVPYGGDNVTENLTYGVSSLTGNLIYFSNGIETKQAEDAKYGLNYELLDSSQWPDSGPLFYQQPSELAPGPTTYLDISIPNEWGLSDHGYGPGFFAKVLSDETVQDLNPNSNSPELTVNWDELRNPNNYVQDVATNSSVWFINETDFVSAEGELVDYLVTISVSSLDGFGRDGTENDVFLSLIGENTNGQLEESNPINLRAFDLPSIESNPFAVGQNSSFLIQAPDFLTLDGIEISVQDADQDYLQLENITVEKKVNDSTVEMFTTEYWDLEGNDELSIFGDTLISSYSSEKFYPNVLGGDNELINDVWFHVLDEQGERTPISEETLDINNPTYFVIHGFTAGVGNNWLDPLDGTEDSQNLRLEENDWKQWEALNSTQHGLGLAMQAYNPDANVVIVDWGELSGNLPFYAEPALNGTRTTANAIAEYILSKGLNPEQVTLVGHSLGGHVAGYTGKEVQANIAAGLYSDGIDNLGTIIGMDSAGPIFESLQPSQRFSASDAENVYNIHTSGAFGYDGSLAEYDLYINNSRLTIDQQEASPDGIISESTSASYDHSGVSSFLDVKEEISNHTYAQVITALMFAENADLFEQKPEESFEDLMQRRDESDFFLFDEETSASFYDGYWTGWEEPLNILQETNYNLFENSDSQQPLYVDNLLNKSLFSDEFFEWDFPSDPFTDDAGFWYDKDYSGNKQTEPISLITSPDTSTNYDPSHFSYIQSRTDAIDDAVDFVSGTLTSLYDYTLGAFFGPLANADIWFDQRDSNGQLDLTLDAETEVTTNTDLNGKFTLAKSLEENNPYTDVTKGVWDGSQFVQFSEQTIDFRDGMVVAANTEGNTVSMIDSITGEDYGVPLIGLPGGNLSIASTMKYAPVLLWSDQPQNITWTEDERFYEKITPQVAQELMATHWTDIPAEVLDDSYDPYTELGKGNVDNLASDALLYHYQILALVQVTKNLMSALEVDRENWGRELSANPTDSPGFLAIQSFGFLFNGEQGNAGAYYTALWEELGYDWTSLDPSNAQQITEAWTYIFNTHATKLGEETTFFGEDGRPIEPIEVKAKVEALPLEWIAEGLARGQNQLASIINAAAEKGTHLIIPSIAGVKQRFLQDDAEGIANQLVNFAFESNTKEEYDQKVDNIFSRSDYLTNYDHPDDVERASEISITTDNGLAVENVVLGETGDETVRLFQIELSRPAPAYGLTVRYALGGEATEGEDYQRPENTPYGSFQIAPGETSYELAVSINGDAIDDLSDSIQLQLLTTDSGFEIKENQATATYVISNEAVDVPESVEFTPTASSQQGDTGDNVLEVLDGADNPILFGGDGADRFAINPNVEGVTYLQDFNPEEGDVIVIDTQDFPDAAATDFTVYGGTLFYLDEAIALIGNVVEGAPQAYSILNSQPNVEILTQSTVVFGSLNDDIFDDSDPNSPYTGNNEIAFTGAGADMIDSSITGNGSNRNYAGSSDDELFAGNSDRLFGGSGDDTLDASQGTGNNRLYGGAGDDDLILGSNDRLIGGAGSDRFFAVAGGDNLITGGAGADEFWIANAQIPESANLITDFTSGEDKIGLGGFPELTFADLSLTPDGDNTIIGFDANTPLATLQGVTFDRLSEGDFVFVTTEAI